MTLRFYKITLILSLLLNVLLITGFWYYRSIEDLLGIVEMAVGFMN